MYVPYLGAATSQDHFIPLTIFLYVRPSIGYAI